MNKNAKFIMRCIGVAFEILGVIAGLAVPITFTIILPIMKTMDYYSNGGDGIGILVKTTLVSVVLSPILAIVIFTPLFLIGAALYTVFEEKVEPTLNENGERMIQISESQLSELVMNQQQQQQAQDDFYIVKEDDPTRSDAGIAEMNWRFSHPELYENKENKNEPAQ